MLIPASAATSFANGRTTGLVVDAGGGTVKTVPVFEGYVISGGALRCVALHCVALHCAALYCVALYCVAVLH